MASSEMTSFRLPGDVVAALRKRASENGEPLSDLLRRAALLVLGKCPTCGQPIPATGEARAREPGRVDKLEEYVAETRRDPVFAAEYEKQHDD